MKRTTTWVFVSPVRPQTSQSRIIQGFFGRAAGAHMPCLPAAQEGQTKSLPRSADSCPNHHWGSCLLLALVCLLCYGLLHAETNPTENKPVEPLTGVTPESKLVTQKLAATCHQADGNLLPTMVVIQPGRFQMGSPDSDEEREKDETQQHQVTIPRPFAISRCEITVGQFRQFVKETGYKTTAEQVDEPSSTQPEPAQIKPTNDQPALPAKKIKGRGCGVWNLENKTYDYQTDRYWDNTGFSQTDQHPVVCISWQDAQRYVAWLSQRTGAMYRLPTEAELEYAARASTTEPRYFIKEKQCDYVNGAGQEAKSIADKNWTLADCQDGFVYTAPVASFAENQFGLFDMLGNALEWTLDCYHDNYTKAPYDGSAWLESDKGQCDRRVVRGGSWADDPQNLRSAYRFGLNTDDAYYLLGFRIARAL